MKWEWPFWRLIENGHSISEVNTWNLEQIFKVLAMTEMSNDYEKAIEGFREVTKDEK